MSSQSEAALENGLIATLQKMNYEYVHIEEEKNLYANFNSGILRAFAYYFNNVFTSSRLLFRAPAITSMLRPLFSIACAIDFICSLC